MSKLFKIIIRRSRPHFIELDYLVNLREFLLSKMTTVPSRPYPYVSIERDNNTIFENILYTQVT